MINSYITIIPRFENTSKNQILLCFFMHRVLAAVLAILFHFQAALEKFFIFAGKIIDLLAFGALEFDHVVLRHNIFAKFIFT